MSDVARVDGLAPGIAAGKLQPVSRMLGAELLGTLMLVATVVGSGIMAERLAGGNMALALLCNTIATGAILYVIITIFGPVSGAHFNPAVTLVFALQRRIGWARALLYVTMQIVGGVMGTLLANAMFSLPIIEVSTKLRAGPAQWLSEAVASFCLVLSILGALRANSGAVAAVVALVITAAYWFTASTSFANPAVAIARSLSDTFAGIAPANVAPFIAAELAGALLALVTAERVFGWTSAVPDPRSA
jgi:glycerol uptake facilitator-like aquaporin